MASFDSVNNGDPGLPSLTPCLFISGFKGDNGARPATGSAPFISDMWIQENSLPTDCNNAIASVPLVSNVSKCELAIVVNVSNSGEAASFGACLQIYCLESVRRSGAAPYNNFWMVDQNLGFYVAAHARTSVRSKGFVLKPPAELINNRLLFIASVCDPVFDPWPLDDPYSVEPSLERHSGLFGVDVIW